MSVEKLVIERLFRLYGEPNRISPEDMDGFLEEYADALEGYAPNILAKAMDRVRDNHAYPTWPTVGEIVKACRHYVPSQPATSKGWDAGNTAKSEESKRRVRQMAEQFRASVKPMPGASPVDYKPMDTSRPIMARNEKRWREAEKITKRMLGEGE